jgi:hypothetical protein
MSEAPKPPPEPKPRMTFWGPREEPHRIGFGEAERLRKLKADRAAAEQESRASLQGVPLPPAKVTSEPPTRHKK